MTPRVNPAVYRKQSKVRTRFGIASSELAMSKAAVAAAKNSFMVVVAVEDSCNRFFLLSLCAALQLNGS
jgi:hypothetical protein